jgi:hypothetical protein
MTASFGNAGASGALITPACTDGFTKLKKAENNNPTLF